MKLYFNSNNEVDFDVISDTTTVQELFNAVDDFLKENPLHCENCQDNCCRKEGLLVRMDNVGAKILSNHKKDNLERFIVNKLAVMGEQFVIKKKRFCTFLDGHNKCSIYDKRPLGCRLFLCCGMGERYGLLMNLLDNIYSAALSYEYMIDVLEGDLPEYAEDFIELSPVLNHNDYNTPIRAILNYVKNIGWIKSEEETRVFDSL